MSTDLVARAVPYSLPASTGLKGDDALVEDLMKLSINNVPPTKPQKEKKAPRTTDAISPADYVTLQSLRSSALARKTNTTSKFAKNGANLFADLLHIDDSKAEEKEEDKKGKVSEVEKTPLKEAVDSKPETSKDDEKDSEKAKSEEGELIPRGPVKSTHTPATFHPYSAGGSSSKSALQYGVAPQTVVDDVTSYNAAYNNYDYACGPNYYNHDLIYSNSSTPDTVISDTSYSSATSPYQQKYYPQQYYQQPQYPSNVQHQVSSVPSSSDAESPQGMPFNDRALTSSDLNRLLSTNNDEDTELPESLSDFILKYSRRYKNEEKASKKYTEAECSSGSAGSSPRHYQRPSSADSGCDSPLSAVSAPQSSPAQPRGGISGPSTPNYDRYSSNTGPASNPQRLAKEKLRSLISDEDMDQAWAWTCKCMMYFPGALSYQDPDRDSLLHIVTKLMDLAKIFTLVERMLKMESPVRLFDMPNKMNETPLFLAVEKRCPEVVEYLLEAGANPNVQTSRPERDAPLQYASTRGMIQMVGILCSHPRIGINAMNGMGLTALLCAVKNHGILEEESQHLIDSRQTIQLLLNYGADPNIPDATNGKTVIHYAVERMDPTLIEIFMSNLNDEAMTQLVNKADLCNETPLGLLQSMHAVNSQTRSALCLTLITCGANNQVAYQQQSPLY